ncbi:HU family DNA-binding protein [Achromobacter xylosoxidans]|uniref:HU family DNA-binding protein n=1 Tax=Achromobacter anxifer TaxID=1287737 RepID=UPI00155CBC8C|nr:HU family DNA-binding protein [Achromobacter anxifer]CAB5514676.1 DNA-binding protein HU [Achromobacter anxifer]
MTTKTTFNMKDLSKAVADNFDMSGKQGAAVVRHVFDTIKAELMKGHQVRLHHFGTLEARSRKAGVARNPQTGQKLTVPQRRVLKLTVATSLKADLAHS